MSYKFSKFLCSSELCWSKMAALKWYIFESKSGRLTFGSHCSSNFQPILDCFIPKFKCKYEYLFNIKTYRVNIVVFNLRQITLCSLNSLYVHHIFTICSPYVHYMFTIYSLYVHYTGCLTIHTTQIHTDNLLLRPVTPKMIAFPGSRYDNNKKLKIWGL